MTDQAGMLSPGVRDRLDARLQAYEQATGHQIVVWIGSTIGDTPLDDWAVKTFAAWKVGRKGLDDGLAVFVLAQDRKIDIEVGYGLEGTITDAIASRIIRDDMAPRLRAGDADGAVTAAVDKIVGTIGGEAGAPPRRTAPSMPPIIPIILGIVFLILFVTHPRMALWLMWSVMSGGRGGGGFGGGGGGGFSGGGGRSGGGGARGSW